MPTDLVYLVDIDNTLLDNDAVVADLRRHLRDAFGVEGERRYWAIFEELWQQLGYADYLGAFQRFRGRAAARSAGDPRLAVPPATTHSRRACFPARSTRSPRCGAARWW